jgi:hypothetical protein
MPRYEITVIAYGYFRLDAEDGEDAENKARAALRPPTWTDVIEGWNDPDIDDVERVPL